jgi:hypothetical protein
MPSECFDSNTLRVRIKSTTVSDRGIKFYEGYLETEASPPTWYDNSTNSTVAGTWINHRLRWSGGGGSDILDGYIFSFCNGTWNGTTCLPEYCDGTPTACASRTTEEECEYDSACTWSGGGGSDINLEFETFDTGSDLAPVSGNNWSTSYLIDPGCVWWKDSDGTASSSTGPCSGSNNCPTNDAGYDDNEYAYVETSYGNCNTGTAHAYLDYDNTLDLSTYDNAHFYFAYNMYGVTMGQLNFQMNNGSGWTTLWTLSGNQGTDWYYVDVDLSDYSFEN